MVPKWKIDIVHDIRWRIVTEHTCTLGESPLWDPAERRILWIDILGKQIHQYFPNQQKHKIFNLDKMPGAIALAKSGKIVAALEKSFVMVDLKNGKIKKLAEVEDDMPDNRFNDGICDSGGRFWAGTMSTSKIAGAGNVYALEQDCSVSKKISEVTVSNGMAWSPDHTTFYHIDTPTQQVVAYNYDVKSGSISNRRVSIHIPKQEGAPDGMTIDAEGMLWIAMWGGGRVARWNPDTGEIMGGLLLPVSQVTSCTFGGKYLDELYVTTANTGLSKNELLKQPLAGSLFIFKNVGTTGVTPNKF